MKDADVLDRSERGKEIEGYAFTFCKAAFLALLFSKYTLLIAAAVTVVLYLIAANYGVRDWRCWVKPPWVVVFWAAVVAIQAYLLFAHVPAIVL